MSNIIKINDAQFDYLFRELVDSNSGNFCGAMLRDCQKIEAELDLLNDDDSRVSSLIDAVSSLKSSISAEQTRYSAMGQIFKVFHDTVHSNDKAFAKYIDTLYSEMTKEQPIDNLKELINHYLDGNSLIDIFGIVYSFEGLDPDDVYAYLILVDILQQCNNMPLDQVQQELAKLEDKALAETLWKIIEEQYLPNGEDPADIVFKIVDAPKFYDTIEKMLLHSYKIKNITLTPTEIAQRAKKLEKLTEEIAERKKQFNPAKHNIRDHRWKKLRITQRHADEITEQIDSAEKALKFSDNLSDVFKTLNAVANIASTVEIVTDVLEDVYLNGLDWDIAIGNTISDNILPELASNAAASLFAFIVTALPIVIPTVLVGIGSIGTGILAEEVYEDADLNIPNEIEDWRIIWSWGQETIDESENS